MYAFRYTLVYPRPVVKTAHSFSTTHEAFAGSVRGTRSQHSAGQSAIGGGGVCLPTGWVLSSEPGHHGAQERKMGPVSTGKNLVFSQLVGNKPENLWFSGRFFSCQKKRSMNITRLFPPLVKSYGNGVRVLFVYKKVLSKAQSVYFYYR